MKAAGRWNIPKGHVEPGETEEAAAIREFNEETSLSLERKSWNDFIPLKESYTKKGKRVVIWAAERDYAVSPNEMFVKISSKFCDVIEHGKRYEVPEMAEAFYWEIEQAKTMIFNYQRCFLERLQEELAKKEQEQEILKQQESAFDEIDEQAEGGAVAAGAECACCGAEAASSECSTPAMNTDAVFGPKGNCDQPVVPAKEKTDADCGICTKDVRNIYVLTRGNYPLFTRFGTSEKRMSDSQEIYRRYTAGGKKKRKKRK